VCDSMNLVQSTTTTEDGSFSFPLFHRTMLNGAYSDANCKQYKFRASKVEDFWLITDENIFSGVTPIVPTICIPVPLNTQPIQIVLSVRGGEVSYRVWDIATNRFVSAFLYLQHKPVEGKSFGSAEWKTKGDGSPDTELLPAGEYTVEVESYPCHTDEYWAVKGPVQSFVVKPATHLDEVIEIDVRNIKPLPRFGGRRRLENCKP
jgi:hypothetical protein